MSDKPDVMERLKKILTEERDAALAINELELKAIGYLFVAHGGGLVACLAALKDYASAPYLKGIGIFITVFAVGFILAILSFFSAQYQRSFLLEIGLKRDGKKDVNMMFLTACVLVPQMLSGLGLFVILLGIIYKFSSY